MSAAEEFAGACVGDVFQWGDNSNSIDRVGGESADAVHQLGNAEPKRRGGALAHGGTSLKNRRGAVSRKVVS